MIPGFILLPSKHLRLPSHGGLIDDVGFVLSYLALQAPKLIDNPLEQVGHCNVYNKRV